MNLQRSIQSLRSEMEASIEALGGHDSVVQICDRMYTSFWRDSKAVEAGVYFGYGEEFYPELEGIDEKTLVVGLCNYKGEGEGFARWEDAKHLPVFRSKDESFFQMV